ncbi:MAG TPA: oligopeptide ABC transporter permease OppB [Spirochaetales bacterium]|nr:oligopeptide ABC transporter permease OppB [Spirochaetales bacterium]HRY55150.1 oligopeptide ABC transporter permease OppB [Spirochaetia bacterium]HRZ64569.1 oligopeptide ABC transporter permease OppB [Spirochaetia bacterium]
MTRFVIRRLLSLIPTLFLIITFAFIIVRVAPGGPFASEKKLPPEIMANILKKYHLDEPLPKQYLRYLNEILHGDLGPSFRYKDYSVNELIGQALPASMLLGFLSLVVALALGLSVGIISSLKQNSWVDYSAMSLAVIGISVPLFVIGPVIKLILAIKLKWLPTSGWLGGRNGILVLIMPIITLSFPYFASIARLMRSSMLEVLRSDYVRTARAKGLKESTVVLKHVLKGAMLPVISYLGPAFAGIITGTVVVETIFTIPGLGRFYIQAATNRDYTLIMGDVIVFSVILVLMNFLVDIIYGFLDPRISYK